MRSSVKYALLNVVGVGVQGPSYPLAVLCRVRRKVIHGIRHVLRNLIEDVSAVNATKRTQYLRVAASQRVCTGEYHNLLKTTRKASGVILMRKTLEIDTQNRTRLDAESNDMIIDGHNNNNAKNLPDHRIPCD